MGKNFIQISFKYGVSGEFSLQFLPRYFYNYFVLVNVYLMQNIKKKPIEIWVSLIFHKIEAKTTLNILLADFL